MSLLSRRDDRSSLDPTRWAPLRTLAGLTAASPRVTTLTVEDFVHLSTVERRGLPRLYRYQHIATGQCLNLDDDLHAWTHRPGAPDAIDGWVPEPSLADAVDALEDRLHVPPLANAGLTVG